MSEDRPPLDIDAITRRLPDRSPTAARARVMRAALLDAAQAIPPPRRWVLPRWPIGIALAGALAAAVVVIVVRAPGDAPRPPPMIAVVTPTPTPPTPPPPAPAPTRAPTPSDGSLAALTDGVTVFEASQAIRWTDRDTTLTAPPGARFVVDVQAHHVRSIAVMSGWVVIASAHSATRMIVERQMWTADAPAPAPAHTPSPAPAIAAPPQPPLTAPPPAPSPPSPSLTAPAPAEPAPTVASPPPDPAAGEHAFRDGLHALLAGDPRTAVGLLDRACNGPAGGIEDSCYWAAVAWLRVGDRAHARRGFDDFLLRWPSSSHADEAHVALGWLLAEAGEFAAARVHFAAAINDPLPDVRREAQRGLAATVASPTAAP